jgi:hypothetical protein
MWQSREQADDSYHIGLAILVRTLEVDILDLGRTVPRALLPRHIRVATPPERT